MNPTKRKCITIMKSALKLYVYIFIYVYTCVLTKCKFLGLCQVPMKLFMLEFHFSSGGTKLARKCVNLNKKYRV